MSNVIIAKGTHEPIISEEQFERVKNKIDEIRARFQKYQRSEAPKDWLFKGLILRMNRSIQVEGAFGVIKQDFRFKRFLTRGKPKTETQFFLISFAYNVEKLFCFARSACAKPGFFCCILMNDIYFCTDSPHSFHTDILFDL